MRLSFRDRPLIPRDMPKLLVVGVAIGGGGYLVGALLAIFFWGDILLLVLVYLMTMVTAGIACVMLGISLHRGKTGVYDRLHATNWRNQVW
jgi:fatty acid desaturase